MSESNCSSLRNPPPTTEIRPSKSRRRLREVTITFYARSSEPSVIPPFPYAVAGAVLGHTKIVAYLRVDSIDTAAYTLGDHFDVAQVEIIEDGWQSMNDVASLRGTVVDLSPGWFSGLRRFLSRRW